MEQCRASKCIHILSLVICFSLVPAVSVGASDADKRAAARVPWERPVPKADCGPNDRVESGLQGQTTMLERVSGLSALGFNCNLELVGQFQGEGAGYAFASHDDCAYFGTANSPLQQNRGVVVVDASDPRNPQPTMYLDSPTMIQPHESLNVHPGRKLLGATKGPGNPEDMFFAFYDISDCAQPVLLSDLPVPNHRGHAGQFSPDGLTYYGAHTLAVGMTAMDISDPTQPQLLGIMDQVVHDLSLSDDGTRAYIAHIGNNPPFPHLMGPNGLVILDISDYQFRRPNPEVRTISELYWDDGGAMQQTLPVTIGKRRYLIVTDEAGAGGPGVGPNKVDACSRGLAPNGFARIIDLSDERHPRIVSKLMIEMDDPARCAEILDSPADLISSSSHYCSVDDEKHAKILACSYREAGLRVFDIRDPYLPKEIAYYKPRGRGTELPPGSSLRGNDRATDHTPSRPRFVQRNGKKHPDELWFTSMDGGFQIVRFTKTRRELLGKQKDDDEDE